MHVFTRMSRLGLFALPLAGLLACGSDPAGYDSTGLAGQVVRSPTVPGCTGGTECEAGFSAWFTVQQNGTAVRRFRSDDGGRFTVGLAPGQYTVVPDPDAPIASPSQQTQQVTVPNGGWAEVKLVFDTGIR